MRKAKKKKGNSAPDEMWRCLIPFDENQLDRIVSESVTDHDRAIYSILLIRPGHKEFAGSASPKSDHISQEEFARFIGSDPAAVSRLFSRGVLTRCLPWRIWFVQWTAYVKGVAAGRRGSGYF